MAVVDVVVANVFAGEQDEFCIVVFHIQVEQRELTPDLSVKLLPCGIVIPVGEIDVVDDQVRYRTVRFVLIDDCFRGKEDGVFCAVTV